MRERKRSLIDNALWGTLYQRHRERIRTATSSIRCRPERVLVQQISELNKCQNSFDEYRRIAGRNMELLNYMNEVSRLSGRINTFERDSFLTIRSSRIPLLLSQIDKIDKENLELGRRLKNAKCVINTRTTLVPPVIEIKKRKSSIHDQPLKVAESIMEKYKGAVQLPSNPMEMRSLLRPRIFFDLELKGLRRVGRISIQLFTEACPEAVLALVRACKNQQKDKVNIRRLFPSLWIEGELALENKVMHASDIEYDKRVIDHGSRGGILSFSTKHVDARRHGLLNFSISFRPLPTLNGKRVAFGVVDKGVKLLQSLQLFGIKNGKLIREIAVTALGIV